MGTNSNPQTPKPNYLPPSQWPTVDEFIADEERDRRSYAAAYQMEQEALRDRILSSISVERHNYRARTGDDPRYVILGRREYIVMRSSPLMFARFPADGEVLTERIHGLEIIEATRRESFIAVCDNAQG